MSARKDTPELSGALGGQTERRGNRRTGVLAQQIILVDVAPLDTGALLSDLSEDGLALRFGMPVPAVPDIKVSFPLDEERVTARCALAWSSPTAWGLKFIELADKDKAKIRKWLDRSTPHDWPTANGTLPAAEVGLPEIAIASSSPQRAATADVGEIAQTANMPKPPGAGAAPKDNRGDGTSPPALAESWVARLMTRQKLANEVRLSAVRKQHGEGVPKQVQKAPPPPAQLPERAEFDRAIRELRAATTRDPHEIPGPLTLIRGGVSDRETKLRRVTPVLSVVFGLAVIAFGALSGFLYATRVSPPAPFPPPSAELGFGSVRAEGRFGAPAFADSHPRRSGEFLALGDNCLDGKKSNCSCSTAVECFRAAAMLGHPGALERLATLYSTGECVSTNRVQAYRAFQQALASDPNPWVQWNLYALWERMTSAERTQVSPPQRP